MKKRVLSVILAGAMCISLAACGSTSTDSEELEEAVDDAVEELTSDFVEEEIEEAEEAVGADVSEDAEEAAESDLAYVQDKGTLVVGITDFEPCDYKDENGEWIGFDADLAKAFAESVGVEAEFVEIDWDNKILELDSESIDCVWNGMTLTDEVTSSMECSMAYLNNQQIVIVKSDVADQYQDVDSLADLTFAVEAGSAGAEAAADNGLATVEVQNQASALMEVEAGTADAAIIDSLMAAAMVGEGTSYEDLTYTVGLTTEEYGVGFRQGSDLAATLDDFFVTASDDGTIAEIADTYGVTAALIEF